MKIENKNGRAHLLIREIASIKDYEVILNNLSKKLKLLDIKEINDFDSYYHRFSYDGHEYVLTYHNSLGISLFVLDDIGMELQNNLLQEFIEILQ